jgi:hypothetical protein
VIQSAHGEELVSALAIRHCCCRRQPHRL